MDDKNNKLKVSIGIPAYNEAGNIAVLLASILKQDSPNFTLQEIIIVSDGSTDETVAKVRTVNDPRIKIWEYKERIGKSQHLNTIFRKAKGDIIVLFDADVVLTHKNVIAKLITPLLNNTKVGLVGGNPQPTTAKTFIEKGVNATFRAYSPLRTILKNGNNAFGCDGRILALSKVFADAVTVPGDMIANDAFLYFSCITKGFLFRHVSGAQVWFTSPKNIKDQVKQNKRFIASHYRLERIFGPVVPAEYHVPTFLAYKLQLREFVRAPFSSLAVFLINLYCKARAKRDEKKMNAKWLMAHSTKEEIAAYF
ncbi:MAG: glycosyltransferase [Patescibacteria group bacterium]